MKQDVRLNVNYNLIIQDASQSYLVMPQLITEQYAAGYR